LDWQFTNVSASSTHLFVSPSTLGINTTLPSQLPLTFELRVTNWAYGIQISNVHTSKNGSLIKVRNFNRKIEFIGDSLTSGMYATYEAFSGFGYGIGAGFGDTEFSITAYPGICLHDANCWGNPRGQTYQWFQTSDTSYRANQIWGVNPEPWNFARQQAADLVLINLGTNDNNTANNVTNQEYLTSYLDFVQEVHKVYPEAQIVIMSLWNGFNQEGSSYKQDGAFVDEIYTVYQRFTGEGWLHYFNSTGILQHNDIGPQYHPTDVGHIKVRLLIEQSRVGHIRGLGEGKGDKLTIQQIASHVMQYIRIKFGWEFASTGPEVQHETLYWNDGKLYG
jgi:hypothetical protein